MATEFELQQEAGQRVERAIPALSEAAQREMPLSPRLGASTGAENENDQPS